MGDEGRWGWEVGRDRGTDATHERFLGRIKQLTDRYQMKERRKEVKMKWNKKAEQEGVWAVWIRRERKEAKT